MQRDIIYLIVAIIAETCATILLKASEGFTRLWPSLGVLLGYSTAFYFLSLTLKTMPTGMAYAIWSGLGIVLVSLVSWLIYGQKLDFPAIVGISFILVGLLIMNLLSTSSAH